MCKFPCLFSYFARQRLFQGMPFLHLRTGEGSASRWWLQRSCSCAVRQRFLWQCFCWLGGLMCLRRTADILIADDSLLILFQPFPHFACAVARILFQQERLDFVELFSGSGALTAALRESGRTGVAIDLVQSDSMNFLSNAGFRHHSPTDLPGTQSVSADVFVARSLPAFPV